MNRIFLILIFLTNTLNLCSQEKCKNLEKGAILYHLIEDGIDFSYQKSNFSNADELAVVHKIKTDAVNFALSYFDKTMRQKPNTLCDSEAFFYAGVLNERLNKQTTAITLLEKFLEKNLIKQQGKFKDFRETHKGKTHYLLAKIFYEKEDYKSASNHIKSSKNWYLGAYSKLYDKEEHLRMKTRILHANIDLKLKKPKRAITHLFNNIFHASESNKMIDKALEIVKYELDVDLFLLNIDNALLKFKKDTFGVMTIYSIELLGKKIELPFSWFKNVDEDKIVDTIKNKIENSYFYNEVIKLVKE